MPYSKTFHKGQKKRRKKKAKSTDGRQNQRIKKLEDLVYPSLEWKSIDIRCTDAGISTTPYVNYPMFQLAQGDGEGQRIGDQVNLKSMNCSLSLTRGDSANIVRLIIAATPDDTHLVASDILEYSNQTTYGEMVFSSPYRRRASTAAKGYQILFDKVYNISADVTTMVDKFMAKLPAKGKKCEFYGVGSTQPTNWNVSVIALSDSSAAPHPVMNLVVRSKYLDL
jgi:hypothetical protein